MPTDKKTQLHNFIAAQTGACKVEAIENLQTLWSGYGEIVRYQLDEGDKTPVIVKHIHPPSAQQHPRGWNTNTSHQRKLHSYQVETHWYQHYAAQCQSPFYVPHCYGVMEEAQSTIIILEDLDAAGYSHRRSTLEPHELHHCLRWLAQFHAHFLGVSPEGLWPIGTYWHFDTRPDEWQAMAEGEIKQAAKALDHRLNNASYKTLVHGDAKVANFCFSPSGDRVAAVDFQYVGGGCGIKDVAYFMGSCMSDAQCERQQAYCLDTYFAELTLALQQMKTDVDAKAVEKEWRDLFPIAWTDFTRFLMGWMPEHKKLNRYSEQLARLALPLLKR